MLLNPARRMARMLRLTGVDTRLEVRTALPVRRAAPGWTAAAPSGLLLFRVAGDMSLSPVSLLSPFGPIKALTCMGNVPGDCPRGVPEAVPGGRVEVVVAGGHGRRELDAWTAAAFGVCLAQAIGMRAWPHVAVDLAALRFCGSSGLRELIIVWKWINGEGDGLVPLNPAGRMAPAEPDRRAHPAGDPRRTARPAGRARLNKRQSRPARCSFESPGTCPCPRCPCCPRCGPIKALTCMGNVCRDCPRGVPEAVPADASRLLWPVAMVAGKLNIRTAAAFGAHLAQAIGLRTPLHVAVDLAAPSASSG
ncbi:STAS domain-containing protein [Spirillospora albida]|uniref:STAS domain-containing protein n=1 Tax=Spirillospora albida TaxID=58123 RepID=UPI0012F79A42|nr:STAS domain-containing protein [Spirillospora albida]